MKAQELRIGNLVWDDYSGEMIVFGVITGGVNPRVELRKSEKLPAGSYDVDKIQGIPLTEDWLKRFGWAENKKFEFFGEFGLVPQGQLYCMARSDAYSVTLFIAIEYVHQLQNLYFALTGEELTLN